MTTKKRMWVIGLESSGTKWVTGILASHPDIESIHSSFPSDGGEDRAYLDAPETLDAIVVVCRDQSCHRRSVVARGYENGREGEFTDGESVERIAAEVGKAECPVVFVSYEGLLIYREHYLTWLWQTLEVANAELDVEYRDANEKYLK